MKRENNLSRWTLHVAVACVVFGGMSGLGFAQIRSLQSSYYTLTDLNKNYTGTGWSFAYAIDNAGQTVGDFVNSAGQTHAFRTQPNAPINYASNDDLGVLPADFFSHAYAVNGSGVVVGDSIHLGGPSRAFRSTSPGAPLDDLTVNVGVPSVLSSATATHPRGINDAGWIVGYFSTSTDPALRDDPSFSHSFLTQGPGTTRQIDLGWGAPAFSATYDVNNRVQLVGWLRPTASDPPLAFFFDAGAGRLIRIGTLPGGATSTANSLNDSGQVVGSSQVGLGTHAFLFQDVNNDGIVGPGELKDLDTLNSIDSAALSINNGGTAVGYFGNSHDIIYGDSKAAIFVNGKMTDLNTLIQGSKGDWTLRIANGINDSGQIVGFMQNASGERHAFRLDPTPLFRL
jgi:probable HAF family extracellular repeat protein